MLAKRVATALVLLAVIVAALAAPSPLPWAIASALFLGLGAFEWSRLLPGAPGREWIAFGVFLGMTAAYVVLRPDGGMPAAGLAAAAAALTGFWVVAGAHRLRTHDARGGGWPVAVLLLVGCWVALYELRIVGILPLFSAMAVIWIADIAAYFIGRAIGRRKLAPTISPGKSWEGAVGAAFVVAIAGLLAAAVPALADSLPALLVGRLSGPGAVMVLAGMVALSVVGDLHESLLKRQAGVKDSGATLPGHGGVLDRIDALIPTMPVALLAYQLLR